MVLVINIIIGILLFNLIGGCFAFLVWKATSRVAMKLHQVNLTGKLLFISILAFAVPLGFAVDAARRCVKYANVVGGWYVFEIVRSKLFLVPASIVIIAWLAGCIHKMIRIKRFHNALWQSRRFGQSLSGVCQRIYEEEKQRLGINGRVVIQKSPLIASAHVFFNRGLHLIQVPAIAFEEEEFRVVCRHELYHVKNNDYRKQRILEWISVVNWYNFFFRRVLKEMNMWTDICRDMEVIGHGDVSARRYYQDMANILRKQFELKPQLPCAMTFASPNTLIYRMNVVTEYFEKERKHSLLQPIAVVLLFSFLSILVIGSEEAVFRRSFQLFYQMPKKSVAVQNTYVPSEEYSEPYLAAEAQLMTEEVVGERNFQFNLAMNTGKRYESEEIYLKKGQILTFIGGANNTSSEYKCGYTDRISDYFIIEAERISHSFSVPEPGYYRFFIENMGTSEEEQVVELTVMIRDAE